MMEYILYIIFKLGRNRDLRIKHEDCNRHGECTINNGDLTSKKVAKQTEHGYFINKQRDLKHQTWG